MDCERFDDRCGDNTLLLERVLLSPRDTPFPELDEFRWCRAGDGCDVRAREERRGVMAGR